MHLHDLHTMHLHDLHTGASSVARACMPACVQETKNWREWCRAHALTRACVHAVFACMQCVRVGYACQQTWATSIC
jgi:hypothetical protein